MLLKIYYWNCVNGNTLQLWSSIMLTDIMLLEFCYVHKFCYQTLQNSIILLNITEVCYNTRILLCIGIQLPEL